MTLARNAATERLSRHMLRVIFGQSAMSVLLRLKNATHDQAVLFRTIAVKAWSSASAYKKTRPKQ